MIGIELIATALAALYVGLGAFTLLLDRIKGMASLRPFAAVAVIAACYTVVSASLYAGNSTPTTVEWLYRIEVLLIGLHSAAWLFVCRLSIPKTRGFAQGVLIIAIIACSATALVPEWACHRVYPRLNQGLTQSVSAVTRWGLVLLAVELLTLFYALFNVRKSDWSGGRSGVVGVGIVCLSAGTTLEATSLVSACRVPFALSIGYFALIVTSAAVFAQAVLSNYGRLRKLSEQLEHDVDLRNQELLQAQAALTRADRLAALGQLAAGVGHEINNPLTYVMTNLRELVEKLPTADDSSDRIQLAGLASEALDGTERIRRVVSDLRLLTRAGENEQLEPLDVHYVLGDALKLTEHVLRHRARVHEDYGDIPRVKAEAQRLAQVFVNLLVNAAQAIPETSADRGTITVRTRRSSTGRAVVEIIDDGQGINPQHLGRIFEPYFTTKTQGEGTGLGLFVSLGIVRSFGGELEVESEVGKGTTMRVNLPASEFVEVFEPSPSQMSALVPRRAKILVIDDEPVVARAMRRMLPDHDVSIALDATHALQAFEQGGVMDVIICDLMMPDISGVDLYVRACDRWPELKPRFLFMTGGAVTPKAQELLQKADVRCLHKPVRHEELLAMIDAIVASVDLSQRPSSSRPVW